MTRISDAVNRVVASPAPVIILDTCNLLDLFRRDSAERKPRAPAAEIRTAAELLWTMSTQVDAIHLVVPELVPRELEDHADRIEREFEGWLALHDENQQWLAEAASTLGIRLGAAPAVHPLGFQNRCRGLADDLLARAIVLDRDQVALDRAIRRLINKVRPSHKKEVKDSMNLEQALELCNRLRSRGFSHPVAFISSNRNDFAASSTSTQIHPDLQDAFSAVSMDYFTCLRDAVWELRASGELP